MKPAFQRLLGPAIPTGLADILPSGSFLPEWSGCRSSWGNWRYLAGHGWGCVPRLQLPAEFEQDACQFFIRGYMKKALSSCRIRCSVVSISRWMLIRFLSRFSVWRFWSDTSVHAWTLLYVLFCRFMMLRMVVRAIFWNVILMLRT